MEKEQQFTYQSHSKMRNKDFLWGVATSAFQLEGSPYADWSTWDSIFSLNPKITNHYELYREDIRLIKNLGVNSYRFSIEWSRIQPSEDYWNKEVVRHYQKIINLLNENNIKPMITIHHFTHPVWFITKYPWHKKKSIDKFMEYVERLIENINNVDYWLTFNEPYLLILGGYIEGCIPPGYHNLNLALKAMKNIFICHRQIYDLLHLKNKNSMVSIAHNMAVFAPWIKCNPFDRLLAKIAKRFYNHSIIEGFMDGKISLPIPFRKTMEIEVPIKGKLDFFGINYYTRVHMRFNPLRKLFIEFRHRDIDGHGLTDMGWEIYPKGLKKVLKYASKLNVPLIITENGIATKDDNKKMKFIKAHVDVIENAISEGIDVRGYFYWSLIDNYEWLHGLDARFGLYRVDFKTYRRIPTKAAAFYSYIINSRNFRS
ncbi:glycoside hydrolase family 1 protein [Thermodesulfovibrio yellowstonii]|uniref:glycoside hydrolase family 1 protein n=1 Tax=Thermodesulfovibrio yellowstonii TaxID=28262 RepID=UPI00048BF87E|nr:family 1 glycosylhydrolase [Thermodesulfovibrio islandicus]